MRLLINLSGDFGAIASARLDAAAGGLRGAAGAAVVQGVARYRAEILKGRLGQRLANSVRGAVYPKSGKSLDLAAFIYTKAPRLIAAFNDAPTIRPVKGSRFLWIPTENVPRQGRKRMTPARVEELYGDFQYVPSLLSRGTFLAVVPAIKAKSKTGYRQATAKRKASGRKVDRIVMFVLVKFVSLRQRIDIAAVERALGAEWPDIVARSLAEAFRNAEGPA